jgi:hypothetical protein
MVALESATPCRVFQPLQLSTTPVQIRAGQFLRELLARPSSYLAPAAAEIINSVVAVEVMQQDRMQLLLGKH